MVDIAGGMVESDEFEEPGGPNESRVGLASGFFELPVRPVRSWTTDEPRKR